MSTNKERLAKDLKIVEQMAAEMEDYLGREEIFLQVVSDDELQPTIGGYLVRQHRLLALAGALLDAAEGQRLQAANQKFEAAASAQPGRFETKARQELEARVRQWGKALQDLLEDEAPSMAYYRSDVSFRAIITTLSKRLGAVSPAITQQVQTLDDLLRKRWQAGEFVWPPEWKPAYPASDYWWLYGKLQK